MDNEPMDDRRVANLDKVYSEASQWVRMCNTLIWQMAAIFLADAFSGVHRVCDSKAKPQILFGGRLTPFVRDLGFHIKAL